MKFLYANNPTNDFPCVSPLEGTLSEDAVAAINEEITKRANYWFSRARSNVSEPVEIDTFTFVSSIPGVRQGAAFRVIAMPHSPGQRSPPLMFEEIGDRKSELPPSPLRDEKPGSLFEWLEAVRKMPKLTRSERCGLSFVIDELESLSRDTESFNRAIVAAHLCLALRQARQCGMGEAQYYSDSLRAIARTSEAEDIPQDSGDPELFGCSVWQTFVGLKNDTSVKPRKTFGS